MYANRYPSRLTFAATVDGRPALYGPHLPGAGQPPGKHLAIRL